MSRLRTIKPGFFLNDLLSECQPLARLLFAGLWTIADREGRLEDRPKRIGAECLPYDDCDIEALLDELAAPGFIVRYEVDGQPYIAVPAWKKHQCPHKTEAPSRIPPPEHSASTVQAQDKPVPYLDLGSCLWGLEKEHMLTADAASVRHEDSNSSFAAFWSTYPRKLGMTAAKKRWKQLSVADRAAATLAAQHYADYVRQGATDLQFVPHPATFIGPKRIFEDWTAGLPPGYEGGNGGGPAPPKRPLCPKCEADLTIDEDGEHCPMCSWRPTAGTPGSSGGTVASEKERERP